MSELDLGANHQGAKDQVSQGKDHIEIAMHVAMVQEVMSVETIKNTCFLHAPLLGQVHAPMEVFVGCVVEANRKGGTDIHGPVARQQRGQEPWRGGNDDQRRAIPPCHGDQVGDVISTLEVVGVVRLEKSMVHTVVSFVRILKEGHRFVHHETMQGPFGKGGVTNTNEDKGQSAE